MSINKHIGAGLLRASVGGRAASLYMQVIVSELRRPEFSLSIFIDLESSAETVFRTPPEH